MFFGVFVSSSTFYYIFWCVAYTAIYWNKPENVHFFMVIFLGWKKIQWTLFFFPQSTLYIKTVETDCSFFVSPPLPPAASPAGPNITLRGQYHCYQGPAIPVDKLCDFARDCPRGDDEGDLCREYTVTSEPETRRPSRLCVYLDPKKREKKTPRPGQPYWFAFNEAAASGPMRAAPAWVLPKSYAWLAFLTLDVFGCCCYFSPLSLRAALLLFFPKAFARNDRLKYADILFSSKPPRTLSAAVCLRA